MNRTLSSLMAASSLLAAAPASARADSFSPAQRAEIDRAIRAAEQECRFEFSVYVGPSHGDARGTAERLHASLVAPGNDVTVLTYGTTVYVSQVAAEETGVDAEVIDLRSLWPLDLETIVKSVKKTGRCVVVHEATRTSGFGAELVADDVTEVTTAEYFAGKQMAPRPVHSTLQLAKLANAGFEPASADDRLQEYLAS